MKVIVCRSCSQAKAEDCFERRRDTGKRRTECKSCRRAKECQRRKTNEKARQGALAAKRRHYWKNVEQSRERSKVWANNNRHKTVNAHLVRTFGITLEDFNRILKSQNFGCAICGAAHSAVSAKTGKPKRLHVDHDHVTGRVRGLLCSRCNIGVGYMRDNAEIALSTALYIERTMSTHTLKEAA